MHRTACLSGLLGLAASVALVTTTRSAHALGPIDLEIGAKAGVGTNPGSGGGPNPLGFGLGGRAGVVLLDHLYGGVNVMYYLGGSDAGVSFHTLMYGVEAGWGWKILDILTIRPQVGVGSATFSTSGSLGSGSTSNWYLEPGVTGLVSLGLLFVGADANVLAFPGLANGNVAFTLHGQVGVKF